MTFACMSLPNPSASILRRGISGAVSVDWWFRENIAATAAGEKTVILATAKIRKQGLVIANRVRVQT